MSGPNKLKKYTSLALILFLSLTINLKHTSAIAPPTLLTANISNTTLTLDYDEALDSASIPSASNFVLHINGTIGVISSVNITGTSVILNISTNIFYGDTVTIDYMIPELNPIQDMSGNDSFALSAQVVTISNNCGTIAAQGSAYSSTLVGTKLYVNNYSTDYLTVIDTITDSTSSILVGTSPAYSTLVGTKLYISLAGGDAVAVVDTSTDTLLATIPVGTNPTFSALVGTKLYVSNFYSNNVSVIDTSTNTVVATILVGNNPFSFTLVGTNLYLNNYSTNNISVIDTSTDTVATTISVTSLPQFSTLAGTKLYVGNYGTNTVSVINTATNTIINTITVETQPIFSTLVGTKLYLSIAFTGRVKVIDTTNDTVITTIDVGSTPLFSTLVGTKLYVANSNSSNVSVIDTTTDTVTNTITVGSNPQFSTLVGTKLYVNNFNTNNISIIDTSTDALFFCAPILLNYVPSPHGYISGDSSQRIHIMTNGTAVSAVPDSGYSFTSWSDGSTVNPRTDVSVASNISIVANFSLIPRGGSGHIIYGCTDTTAINYQQFVANDPNLCKYPENKVENSNNIPTNKILGSGSCPTKLIITDNMKQGDHDGKTTKYNNNVEISQVRILQSHINRILATDYEMAAGPRDGSFGPLTRTGVERLQTSLNTTLKPNPILKIDGIVGPFTKASINNSCGGM